jgi:hypothetical protein
MSEYFSVPLAKVRDLIFNDSPGGHPKILVDAARLDIAEVHYTPKTAIEGDLLYINESKELILNDEDRETMVKTILSLLMMLHREVKCASTH